MPSLAKDIIAEKIEKALEQAKGQGLLPLETIPEVTVERPAKPEHGDFATNVPMRLARATRIAPLEIAKTLARVITADEIIEKATAAPPGFINFTLKESWLQEQVEAIRKAGQKYGAMKAAKPQKVMIEFVSVNPTGPVHVGHTRGAVLGSALASVLGAAGHRVTREYYVNDAGTQMELFYGSVLARYLQALGREAELPAGGYQGEYISELAREILSEEGERFAPMERGQALKEMGDIAREKMVAHIREDLLKLGVEFHHWFSEHTLYDTKEYDEAIGLLKEKGHLAQREGALWFASSALGEDKDNVVVRSSGAPTYFASDIAYHHNKFIKRDFDRVINIWGADHQGHVSRLKAAVGALGVEPSRLEVIIAQMVTLKRGDQVVKASKRAGEFVTLRELVEEVGPDACRYFFLARAPNTQMDFDLELAKKESSENPVYYVQYAHARIAGILRSAKERGLEWSAGDVSLLKDTNELALIRKMLELPELVERAASKLEPHHLPHYALELATAFHWFYENCRVLSSDPKDTPISLARLKLVEACKVALGRTLGLMGMRAPERM
ncbi:MAG: arginine--tRNA ligase [SAR202 cluster bacterium]|nr:arginine--tRNA ligase [SAR202 cluster bacterium]